MFLRNKLSLVLLAATLIQLGFACPEVVSEDGSYYDLSAIAGRHQFLQPKPNGLPSYNISICKPLSDGCANNCAKPNTAGACEYWASGKVVKCVGSYSTHQVIGLNNRKGVRITYSGGDFCENCNPPGNRTTVITLLCANNVSNPSVINWTSYQKAFPVVYLNGTFNCGHSSPVRAPATPPVRAPVTPPSPPQQHLKVEYTGYGTGCNGSDATMVTVDTTTKCTPGCKIVGNKYIYTECDRIPHLAPTTWIEHITGSSCLSPESAVFLRAGTCNPGFSNSKWLCDASMVYVYSCTDSFCNQCSLTAKVPTNKCTSDGRTQYLCVN